MARSLVRIAKEHFAAQLRKFGINRSLFKLGRDNKEVARGTELVQYIAGFVFEQDLEDQLPLGLPGEALQLARETLCYLIIDPCCTPLSEVAVVSAYTRHFAGKRQAGSAAPTVIVNHVRDELVLRIGQMFLRDAPEHR